MRPSRLLAKISSFPPGSQDGVSSHDFARRIVRRDGRGAAAGDVDQVHLDVGNVLRGELKSDSRSVRRPGRPLRDAVQHRFVLSQLTDTVGASITDTSGWSYTSTVGIADSVSVSASTSQSETSG